jgi:hypothetical protein
MMRYQCVSTMVIMLATLSIIMVLHLVQAAPAIHPPSPLAYNYYVSTHTSYHVMKDTQTAHMYGYWLGDRRIKYRIRLILVVPILVAVRDLLYQCLASFMLIVCTHYVTSTSLFWLNKMKRMNGINGCNSDIYGCIIHMVALYRR